ncbi:hypothetical protein [Halodesulfovibrio marinisediminis]|uniref:Uncharacterized protein n=1 Tax=Halodesulfovibrio marinisediminis DSM 17456 TaxID=1121457 RepID=A0A1N6ICG7_9BACT|nr:hypothetical protein [Halodesulfovibrio marinisediminis]SIO29679.1 hypothetical protein SAMN02745161_2619 [Halodesulfovibrio marinisediminis DSM 17456]
MEHSIWSLMTNLAVTICVICSGLICTAVVGIRSSKIALSDSIKPLTNHNEI